MDTLSSLKQIPYGVSDFAAFSEKNRYYVDKTHFIPIIEAKGDFLFFIRPRRFGKSLLLSTLELYYDISQKENFAALFDNTFILQQPTNERNSYLVLKMDFSSVNPEPSLVEVSFLNQIKFSAHLFLNKYHTFLKTPVDESGRKTEALSSASDVLSYILNLCRISGQKLYVIIDEYDNFANTILSASGEHEYRGITHGEGFLRAFFNVLKSGTSGGHSPISRLFITGVSPITMDDVTSGFNIGVNISLHADISEMVGFTRKETETLIQYYRQTGKIPHATPELLDLMSHWYNHYRFSKSSSSEVFNPVQVLYFLSSLLESSAIPENLIDRNVRIDYHKLRHLIILDQKGSAKANGNFSKLREIIENGHINSTIQTGFSIAELTRPENFASLLYYFGLLTISGSDEENKAILSIPNETVKRLFYDYIRETYEETGEFSLDMEKYSQAMRDMAFKGQWRPLIEYLAHLMENSTGLRDLIHGEKTIQAFLNVYLGLSNLFILHSERESHKGFVDLTLEPFIWQYPAIKYGYLMEIKYIKSGLGQEQKSASPVLEREIQKQREAAESQLKHYFMDEKLRKNTAGVAWIRLVLIFCGCRLVYSNETAP